MNAALELDQKAKQLAKKWLDSQDEKLDVYLKIAETECLEIVVLDEDLGSVEFRMDLPEKTILDLMQARLLINNSKHKMPLPSVLATVMGDWLAERGPRTETQ